MAKKCKTKKKMSQGGILPDEIGALLPLLNFAVPGLGAVAGGVNNVVGKIAPSTYEPVKENTNPYGMSYGGLIPRKGDVRLGNRGFQVKDSSGKTDGKAYGGNLMLDNNEVQSDGYVFSDDLGFAKQAKKIVRALANNDKQPNDFIKSTTERMLNSQKDNLMAKNEMARVLGGSSAIGMKNGGPVPKDVRNQMTDNVKMLNFYSNSLQDALKKKDYNRYQTIRRMLNQKIYEVQETVNKYPELNNNEQLKSINNTIKSKFPELVKSGKIDTTAAQVMQAEDYNPFTDPNPPIATGQVPKNKDSYKQELDGKHINDETFSAATQGLPITNTGGFNTFKVSDDGSEPRPKSDVSPYSTLPITNRGSFGQYAIGDNTIPSSGNTRPTTTPTTSSPITAPTAVTSQEQPFTNKFKENDLPVDMGGVRADIRSMVTDEILAQKPVSTPDNMTDEMIEAEYARQEAEEKANAEAAKQGTGKRKPAPAEYKAYNGYDPKGRVWTDDDGNLHQVNSIEDIGKRQDHLISKGLYPADERDSKWGTKTERGHRLSQGPVQTIESGGERLVREVKAGDKEIVSKTAPDAQELMKKVQDGKADRDNASANGSWWNAGKVGDILQGVEVASKLFDAARPVEVEQVNKMRQRQIDTAPLLRRSSETLNAALSGTNSFRPSARNAMLSNMYAQKLNSDAQMMSQVANQNRSLAAQTEQFNIGQMNYTADLNARNRAAQQSARNAAFTSIGNTGRALGQQHTNRMGAAFMNEAYQEVSPFFWDGVNKRLKYGMNG